MTWKPKKSAISIETQLLAFAEDEGKNAALDKCEQWHDVLEEMLEVGNKSQRQAISVRLLAPIKNVIRQLCDVKVA